MMEQYKAEGKTPIPESVEGLRKQALKMGGDINNFCDYYSMLISELKATRLELQKVKKELEDLKNNA